MIAVLYKQFAKSPFTHVAFNTISNCLVHFTSTLGWKYVDISYKIVLRLLHFSRWKWSSEHFCDGVPRSNSPGVAVEQRHQWSRLSAVVSWSCRQCRLCSSCSYRRTGELSLRPRAGCPGLLCWWIVETREVCYQVSCYDQITMVDCGSETRNQRNWLF